MKLEELIEAKKKERENYEARTKPGQTEYTAAYIEARIDGLDDFISCLESLSESHKAEIVEAYEADRTDCPECGGGIGSGEDYYQKTYGK